MKDRIQALNYSAHAIEQMNIHAKNFQSRAPHSAKSVLGLIELLEKSVKFILPNRCNLIDPKELKQSHLDLLKLPYPIVALEAPWEFEKEEKEKKEEKVDDFSVVKSNKRIALCWDVQSNLVGPFADLCQYALEAFPDGGVCVTSIYWSCEYRHWFHTLGGSFIPYNNTLLDAQTQKDDSPLASQIAMDIMLKEGRANSRSKGHRAEPFVLMPEYFEQSVKSLGEDQALSNLILDLHDEVSMLLQTCSVINCNNIITSEIKPPATFNKKRCKNGKQPFFTYKILQLNNEINQSIKSTGTDSHASPRMHLRRGHIRRLEKGSIWIRPAIINANAKHGIVLKDYALAELV